MDVSYLPSDPSSNRPGSPEFQPFPSLLFAGVGFLFASIGVALTWTAVRQRRIAAAGPAGFGEIEGAAALPAVLPPADPAGRHRFTRSPIRVLVDLVGAPVGLLWAALGMALYSLELRKNPAATLART